MILFFCLGYISIIAQNKAKEDFSVVLKSAKVDFAIPTEVFLRNIRIVANDIQPYQSAFKGKHEKVEIRYFVKPLNEEDKYNLAPQVLCASIASSIASNHEDKASMVFHPMIDESLLTEFNADYGVDVYLSPKKSFSDKKYCRMQFLFARDKGVICTFILFDNPRVELEKYVHNMRFLSDL